jgi:hypothetical protein
MKKYRIVEIDGKFHAQERQCILLGWEYLSNFPPYETYGLAWSETECNTIAFAMKIIQKRKKYRQKRKMIIHELNKVSIIKKDI